MALFILWARNGTLNQSGKLRTANNPVLIGANIWALHPVRTRFATASATESGFSGGARNGVPC